MTVQRIDPGDWLKMTNPIVFELSKLEVGEAVFIPKLDWTLKTSIITYISQYSRKGRSNALSGKKFTTKLASHKSGWLVERVK